MGGRSATNRDDRLTDVADADTSTTSFRRRRHSPSSRGKRNLAGEVVEVVKKYTADFPN
jgi:hypothetical protein